MRVLVTGGAGFIGSNMVTYHLNKGDEVIAVDDLSTGKESNIAQHIRNKQFTFYHEDILTWKGLDKVLNQVERVYHLAAIVGMFNVIEYPIVTLNVNIQTTFRLCQLMSQMIVKPLLIISSSSEVYGDQSKKLRENMLLTLEDSLKFHSAYVISKLCNESVAHSHYLKFNLPCIILRIFNTIGMNQSRLYGMVVPRLIHQAINNKPITVFGDGSQRRSFCDVRDLIQEIDLVAKEPGLLGEVINIGSDEEITILQLAKQIKKLSQSSSEIVFRPFETAYGNQHLYIHRRCPDLTKLKQHTSFKVNYHLQSTLKDLIKLNKA